MSLTSFKLTAVAAGMLFISPLALAADHVVTQHNKSFQHKDNKIEKIAVRVGDSITFRNDDPFFHNIFSLSDLKTFDLGSYPTGQSKTVTFDKAGTVDVECAIHPSMQLKVEVK